MGKKRQIRELEAERDELRRQLSMANDRVLRYIKANQELTDMVVGPTVSAARIERDDDGMKFYDERNQVRMRI